MGIAPGLIDRAFGHWLRWKMSQFKLLLRYQTQNDENELFLPAPQRTRSQILWRSDGPWYAKVRKLLSGLRSRWCSWGIRCPHFLLHFVFSFAPSRLVMEDARRAVEEEMDITWARAFLSQDVTKFSAWRWYTPQTQCRDFRVLVIRYPRVPNVASTLEPHESASLFFSFVVGF